MWHNSAHCKKPRLLCSCHYRDSVQQYTALEKEQFRMLFSQVQLRNSPCPLSGCTWHSSTFRPGKTMKSRNHALPSNGIHFTTSTDGTTRLHMPASPTCSRLDFDHLHQNMCPIYVNTALNSQMKFTDWSSTVFAQSSKQLVIVTACSNDSSGIWLNTSLYRSTGS